MSIVFRPLNLLLAPVAVAAAIGIAACGSNDKVKDAQHTATQLQKQALETKKNMEKTAADLKAGKVSSDDAEKQLQKQTEDLQDKVNTTADKAIDAAKSQAGMSDEAQKALDDAKKQLDASTK
jgi:methylthioribose-1-phosphate isomerase